MKWDLKRPCKNCPFVNTPNRIKFAARERAIEIEEHAYRSGFVCHEHGVSTEDEDGEEGGGIDFRPDGTSQHCWGALAMFMKNGSGNVPFENENYDGKLGERWWERADMKAIELVFANEEAFFDANDPDYKPPRKRRRR